jgi:hypothetical protein
MDLFFGICQALGVGIAIGALCGAAGLEGQARTGLIALAAILGAAAGGFSASSDDVSVLAGVLAGAVGGLLASAVVSDVVAGAGRRGQARTGGIGLMVAAAAVLVAGLSILLPPLALIALIGLLWLAAGRRRRSQRKYEGLRVLR